jgi:hypothetical protein
MQLKKNACKEHFPSRDIKWSMGRPPLIVFHITFPNPSFENQGRIFILFKGGVVEQGFGVRVKDFHTK